MVDPGKITPTRIRMAADTTTPVKTKDLFIGTPIKDTNSKWIYSFVLIQKVVGEKLIQKYLKWKHAQDTNQYIKNIICNSAIAAIRTRLVRGTTSLADQGK